MFRQSIRKRTNKHTIGRDYLMYRKGEKIGYLQESQIQKNKDGQENS
jgi:hypothetical protein